MNAPTQTTPKPVMLDSHRMVFIAGFNAVASACHEIAREKGWWHDREKLIAIAKQHGLGDFAETAIRGLSIALKHSELSEALEGIRHGNPPDDKIPGFTSEEAEYADAIIRIMDCAARNGLRVAEAICAKMEMNRTREHLHGGKSC